MLAFAVRIAEFEVDVANTSSWGSEWPSVPLGPSTLEDMRDHLLHKKLHVLFKWR